MLKSNIHETGYRLYFVFDHSSCHGTYAADALDASKMNLKPGGKQPRMHNTYWQGRLQRMVFRDGTPKGLKNVLIERGIDVRGMKLEDMRNEISTHPDFRVEQPEIAHFLRKRGHACIFLPKFHRELKKNVGHKPNDILVPTQTIQSSAFVQLFQMD